MTDVTAETASKTAPESDRSTELDGERMALDRRYGKIGISAVAAAARYASGAGAGGAAQQFSRQKSEL
jgi:hypothetical protein